MDQAKRILSCVFNINMHREREKELFCRIFLGVLKRKYENRSRSEGGSFLTVQLTKKESLFHGKRRPLLYLRGGTICANINIRIMRGTVPKQASF
jgi:hypothetical protein